ncbi:MFS transporter [Desulfitobacterium sp. PCE1]|uniref:MFS transporter n=1 Tax=Desulfitobacterium sp. PCE1 TaxID=146907 RepID=UPI00035FD0D4|nr:MFS transporter [Desulfitobacterium sp. PCE1]
MENQKVLTSYFDGVKVTSKHLKIVLLIAMGLLFDMMDNYNFSFVAPTLMKNWGITMEQVGQINSMFFIGMLVGSLFGGFISDHIGRKKAFLASSVFFSVFSLSNAFVTNVQAFMVMRFLTGVGIASLIIVAVPYMVEMLPAESRGKWQALGIGLGYIGIPAIAIFCKKVIPLAPENWRYVYAIGGGGLIIAILGLLWLEESPRWLVSKGRVAEAERIVEKMTGYKADLSGAVRNTEKVSVLYVLKEMFSKKLYKNTLVLLEIFWFAYAAGFIFISFAPTLFVTKGYSIEDGLTLSMMMSFGFVAGPFVAAAISDKGGRKWPIVALNIAALVLSIVYASLNNKTGIYVVAVLIAVIIQAMCAVTQTYLGELFPTNIRNAASGIIYSSGRIPTAVAMVAIPVINRMYGYVGVFAVTGMIYVLTAIIVGVWGVRASGKSLEQINE